MSNPKQQKPQTLEQKKAAIARVWKKRPKDNPTFPWQHIKGFTSWSIKKYRKGYTLKQRVEGDNWAIYNLFWGKSEGKKEK